MYNPLPYLPRKFQRIIRYLQSKKFLSTFVFITMGVLATLWFLIRVIPKPSRASYPCMQATAPFMSALVMYLLGTGGASFALRQSRLMASRAKPLKAFLFAILAGVAMIPVLFPVSFDASAGEALKGKGYFTPNQPIGDAKGIFPGRVTWFWDQDATNENCANTSDLNGVIDAGDDAWFMEANNDRNVIDSLIRRSLIVLSGASDEADAWDLIFKYYNSSHGLGNVGYTVGQKLFIKINCTSAWGGLADGSFYSDMSRNDDIVNHAFGAETNPYIVLSVLRQLVNEAGVLQNDIYVGDPARNIYQEFYTLWHNEFPGVHYLGNNLIHTEIDIVTAGRTPVALTATDRFFFSDQGTVMPDAITDKLFTIFDSIDYLINIPTMKAHGTAGITLAAKNHFGSFPRQWAMHLHPGLFDGVDNPIRVGYGLYRIQTDIMMHRLLSGKNLLIVVDGLYTGPDAVAPPDKWLSPPFAGDWCSSIYMSLDPVAIESVCHDFLRTEYNGSTVASSRPNWFGVDDYLHQAADSSLWPAGISYDPDNDGILIASLGVHEHWNDSINKQYTRNLGTGFGIELVKLHEPGAGLIENPMASLVKLWPNPSSEIFWLENLQDVTLEYVLYDVRGAHLGTYTLPAKRQTGLDMSNRPDGIYYLHFVNSSTPFSLKILKTR